MLRAIDYGRQHGFYGLPLNSDTSVPTSMWGHRLRNSSSSVPLDVSTQAEPRGSQLLGCVCRTMIFSKTIIAFGFR